MEKNVIPFENLDLESDVLFMKPGAYRDALDVTPISDGHGNTVSWEAVLGNDFEYTIGSVNVSPKRIRIQLAVGASSYEFDFRRPNNTSMGTQVVAQNASASVMLAAAVASFQVLFPTANIQSNLAGVWIDIGNLDIYGWEWYINNIGTQVATFTTMTEAIDIGAAGEFIPMGFYDLLGDQFVWSCTRKDFIKELPVTAVLVNITGETVLQINNHGLKNGEAITIRGVNNNGVSMNGEYIALEYNGGLGQRDANNIVLLGTTFTGPYTLTNAVATVNLYSVSQIGVSVEDPFASAPATTYTRLIATKSMGLRAKKRVHPFVEPDINKKNIYFTDGINPMRALYYYGPYETDGFLNTENAYTFDTINSESRFVINDFNVGIGLGGLINGGGNVFSGNHRFTLCLVSDAGIETEYTELSGPVNVFSPIPNFSTSDLGVHGDSPGTLTNKKIKLTISGLNKNLFKYVKLVDIQFSGGAKIAYTVGKYLITDTSMDIIYTGFEALEVLDIGTLNFQNANYITAESMDVLDRKMILSNVTGEQTRDFAAFFATFRHDCRSISVPSIGHGGYDKNKFEEFLKPDNVFARTSYMVNETYRFMAGVKMKSGYKPPQRWWVDDICIDMAATNAGNVFGGGARRDNGLPTISLTDSTGASIILHYVEFHGFDLNYIIDGQRVKDLISEIFIEVVPMNEGLQEVVAYGFSIPCQMGGHAIGGLGVSPNPEVFGINYGTGVGSPNNRLFEWFFQEVPGTAAGIALTPGYASYSSFIGAVTGTVARPDVVSFYCPDVYLGGKEITYLAGDKLLCFDDAHFPTFENDSIGAVGALPNNQVMHDTYVELSNFLAVAGLPATNPATYTFPITDCKFVSKGSDSQALSGITPVFSKIVHATITPNVSGGAPQDNNWNFDSSHVIASSAPFTPAGGWQKGLFYSQYFRNKGKGAKFGPINTSVSVPTGASLLITESTNPTTSNVNVFGGDVFTQNTYFKYLYPQVMTANGFIGPLLTGMAMGVRVCTQNRINAQMRYALPGVPIPAEESASSWLNSDVVDEFLYDHGYDINNNTITHQAFDSTARRESATFWTRIPYSNLKPNNSLEDNYRRFLPLNFRDLDQNQGMIIHHEVINGELLTWQQRSFMRQYFNSNGVLVSKDGSEVILGDGAALTRRGLTVSGIGTKHKWSIIKGMSKGGNDVVLWLNTEYGMIVRFGYDGVNPVSVVHNINGFIDKNTAWADHRFSPADDEGPHGVWNEERKEYVITVRARKTTHEEFDPRRYYQTGNTVFAYDGLSQLPRIYRALKQTVELVGVGLIVVAYAIDVTNPTFWEELTDPSLRNEYTLAFNELKNGFTCRYSFIPKIYGKWKKGYVSSHPTKPSFIYKHNKGSIGNWYSFNGTPLVSSTPYIQMVMNDHPDAKKNFTAIELNCQLTPDLITRPTGNVMDFITEQHVSYLKPDEFERSEEQDIGYASPIKNDSSVSVDNPTGVNDADTSNLFGRYLLATYKFSKLAYDKLFGVVIKYSSKARENRS